MMSKHDEAKQSPRREFLKLTGLGTLAGAATLAGGVPREAEAASTDTGSDYRETEHVKKVYELARF